jgi:hypothetical protein
MAGYPDGTFKPNQAISTREVRIIVIEYMAIMQKKYGSYKKALCPNCKTNFHMNEIYKFLNNQQMTGAPRAFTTTIMNRAEILTVINRLFFRGPLTQGSFKNWTDVPSTYWAYGEIQEASHDHTTTRSDFDLE